MPEETIEKRIFISRYKRSGKHFIEALSDEIGLDMVLYSWWQIPDRSTGG